jgi:hypothetical protein
MEASMLGRVEVGPDCLDLTMKCNTRFATPVKTLRIDRLLKQRLKTNINVNNEIKTHNYTGNVYFILLSPISNSEKAQIYGSRFIAPR